MFASTHVYTVYTETISFDPIISQTQVLSLSGKAFLSTMIIIQKSCQGVQGNNLPPGQSWKDRMRGYNEMTRKKEKERKKGKTCTHTRERERERQRPLRAMGKMAQFIDSREWQENKKDMGST